MMYNMSRVKRSLRPGEVHLKKRRPQRVNVMFNFEVDALFPAVSFVVDNVVGSSTGALEVGLEGGLPQKRFLFLDLIFLYLSEEPILITCLTYINE